MDFNERVLVSYKANQLSNLDSIDEYIATISNVQSHLREAINMEQLKKMRTDLANLEEVLGKAIHEAGDDEKFESFVSDATALRESVKDLYKEIISKKFENIVHRTNGEAEVVDADVPTEKGTEEKKDEL